MLRSFACLPTQHALERFKLRAEKEQKKADAVVFEENITNFQSLFFKAKYGDSAMRVRFMPAGTGSELEQKVQHQMKKHFRTDAQILTYLITRVCDPDAGLCMYLSASACVRHSFIPFVCVWCLVRSRFRHHQ
jgi:hypothetical protein